MKQTTYTTKVIVPEEGYYLTQAEEVEPNQRIFSKEIFLAVNDSPANWKEITEEEVEKLIAIQNEAN
ncbi:MAG: hypothetical protein HDS49_04750 [Bacteroides sp.]|nr:hypothetical protein [Bacteroides sp.]